MERLLAGDDHAAFACRDRLVAEEAEGRDIAEGADVLAADARTESLGAIFDQ